MKLVENDHPTKNSYKPSCTLTNYLDEKLQILNLEREIAMRGEELSDEDKEKKVLNQEKKILNRRKKNYVLNRHVFESMANLITFFEFITLHHPELQEDFKNELEELLTGWNKDDESKTPAFSKLINGAISWDYKEDRSNFRLSLLYAMQYTIKEKLPSFAKYDFHSHPGEFGWTISEKMVGEDMERAIIWAGFFAKNILKSGSEKEWENAHAHRPVLF